MHEQFVALIDMLVVPELCRLLLLVSVLVQKLVVARPANDDAPDAADAAAAVSNDDQDDGALNSDLVSFAA